MKYIIFYFSCLLIVVLWGCSLPNEPEVVFPVTSEFKGKFVFDRDVTGSGAGQAGIEIFTHDQSGVKQVTMGCKDGLCHKENPEWIYPGNKILYRFNGHTGVEGYYVADSNGLNNHLLFAHADASYHFKADVSDDGNLFAVVDHNILGLYQFQADSLAIIDSVAWTGNGSVVISHSNDKILIYDYSHAGLRMGIYTVGQPGINLYSDSESGMYTDAPSFSFQSNKIVYISNSDIFVIQADGSNPEKITDTKKSFESDPQWSPVEDCIAYSRYYYNSPNRPHELILFNYDSKVETVILSDASIRFIDDVKWSADGQQIAFHNLNDPNLGVFIINKDGTSLKRISKELFSYGDWFTK